MPDDCPARMKLIVCYICISCTEEATLYHCEIYKNRNASLYNLKIILQRNRLLLDNTTTDNMIRLIFRLLQQILQTVTIK